MEPQMKQSGRLFSYSMFYTFPVCFGVPCYMHSWNNSILVDLTDAVFWISSWDVRLGQGPAGPSEMEQDEDEDEGRADDVNIPGALV